MASKTEAKVTGTLAESKDHNADSTALNSKPKTACGAKKQAVLVSVGNTGGEETLQQRFMRFKRQRTQALRAASERKAKERSDPGFKDKLRAKFVETAKKYIGVPYAQKYHEPGTEMYDAPLFLDCCGLVRRTMDDLQEDFGFRIGRWNQAYMYDTLPKEVTLEEMKPGDLIFYSGIYYRKNAKLQKHNMVHVEIFLGGETGEASLGARWQKGRCKVFDSFKFTSKNYHSIEYHFRSLDTWLEGECKSHCDEHPWVVQGFKNVNSAKSVFFQQQQQAADGGDMEADSGDEGEGAGEGEGGKQKGVGDGGGTGAGAGQGAGAGAGGVLVDGSTNTSGDGQENVAPGDSM